MLDIASCLVGGICGARGTITINQNQNGDSRNAHIVRRLSAVGCEKASVGGFMHQAQSLSHNEVEHNGKKRLEVDFPLTREK